MIQKYGRFFLLAMMLMVLGLSLNACSDSDDDPVTPPPGGGDGDTDTLAPVLVTTNPSPGNTGLTPNETLIAIFSEPLDVATLNGNITISPGTVTDLILTGNEVQIVHNPFNAGDAITITFAVGLADTSGNHLAQEVQHQYWVETDEVLVVGHTPADGSTDVLRNLPFTVRFNQIMDEDSFVTGIIASTPDKAVLAYSVGNRTNANYTLDFDEELPEDTEVTITIGTTCASVSGETLETAVVFSFQTGLDIDETPPALLSIEPHSGSVVSGDNLSLVFTFDEPIANGRIQALKADINLMLGTIFPGASETWNEDDTVFTLVMSPNLQPGVTLSLQLDDFADNQGNINESHPTWTATISGTADHYPVEELLEYQFEYQESGGDRTEGYYDMYFRNVWTDADHFRHERLDNETELWNEWDNMIRTSSAIELNGFREIEEGTPGDVTFNHPVQFLNHPTVTASWSDNIVVTTSNGSMDVSFSAEVLPGETEVPFNMGGSKMGMQSSIFSGGSKGTEPSIVFSNCRTVINNIEGTIDGNPAFTSIDTLVYCPGFGLVRENVFETHTDDKSERYSTSEVINVDFTDK